MTTQPHFGRHYLVDFRSCDPSSLEQMEVTREIFLRALAKPTEQARADFLDGACGKNLSLRSKVEALLENHKQDTENLVASVRGPVHCYNLFQYQIVSATPTEK